jgi:hypothetical protein
VACRSATRRQGLRYASICWQSHKRCDCGELSLTGAFDHNLLDGDLSNGAFPELQDLNQEAILGQH